MAIRGWLGLSGRARQRREAERADLFRALGRFDPGRAEPFAKIETARSGKALERVAQHLAPLAEGGERQLGECRKIARRGVGARDQLDDAGGDFRLRREGARRARRTAAAPARASPPARRAARSRRDCQASRRCAARPRAGTSGSAARRRAARAGLRASRPAAASRCCRAGWRRFAAARQRRSR